MKALIIGYGSIGQRHARLLQGLGLETAVVSRRAVDAANLYAAIPEAVADWGPEYAVVASRTHEHRNDFKALSDSGFKGRVLMEKPLFDRGDDVPTHEFEKIFVAYNLRFHPVIARFRELLSETEPFAVHAYVGQYLPDWRPDADYRQGYSAIKAQGGGVLRDLSHELDALNWMLGGWTRMTALGGHVSNLEIDSDDVFSLLFETRRCPVASVQMNYLDSTLTRTLTAMTDRGTIRADLVAGTLAFDDETEIFTPDRDDSYIAQHRAILEGGSDVLCTLDEGLDVMRMIEAAEAAALEKKWVAA